jgi:hypothetical protein
MMKKTAIAAIILVAGLVGFASYYLFDFFLGDPFERQFAVEYMDTVSDRLNDPNPELFNREAINPTVEISIGEDIVEEEAVDETPISDNWEDGGAQQ